MKIDFFMLFGFWVFCWLLQVVQCGYNFFRFFFFWSGKEKKCNKTVLIGEGTKKVQAFKWLKYTVKLKLTRKLKQFFCLLLLRLSIGLDEPTIKKISPNSCNKMRKIPTKKITKLRRWENVQCTYKVWAYGECKDLSRFYVRNESNQKANNE